MGFMKEQKQALQEEEGGIPRHARHCEEGGRLLEEQNDMASPPLAVMEYEGWESVWEVGGPSLVAQRK